MSDGPAPNTGFFAAAEEAVIARFLDAGYLIVPVEDAGAFERIRTHVAALAARHLGLSEPDAPGPFLDTIHERVDVAGLNDLRLAVIRGMNREPWFRPAYHALARNALGTLVGNELAMQRRINLSVQLPDDSSSLLPVHADVWSGDSPYEVVVWVPLVDCYRTKSMYITERRFDERTQKDLARFAGQSAEDLYQAIEDSVTFLEIPAGHCLLFTQNLMHGNRVNREPSTRWSMNCRFKGLFTPYADKKLGEFFEPITMRPASRFGLDYRLPEGFHE